MFFSGEESHGFKPGKLQQSAKYYIKRQKSLVRKIKENKPLVHRKKAVPMDIEKRKEFLKSENEEQRNKPMYLNKGTKITLSIGVVLALTLLSLATVVHFLGNIDLQIRLQRKK